MEETQEWSSFWLDLGAEVENVDHEIAGAAHALGQLIVAKAKLTGDAMTNSEALRALRQSVVLAHREIPQQQEETAGDTANVQVGESTEPAGEPAVNSSSNEGSNETP